MQVKQGENIVVTTSENLKVNNVKAKNVQGQQVDLLPLPNNLWSLQNLIPGVYLLDVSVDMSSSGILGVYETVLVILQPNQPPLPPTTVINEVSIIIDNVTTPSPEPLTPCPPDAPESEVCPPTDEITPPPCPPETRVNGVCPPTDEITPLPEPPPPDCPEAGPEICGEEAQPPPGDGPDSGDNGENGNDNGSGNDNGNGDDGSNGDGSDNEGSEENEGMAPPFG